MADQRTKSELYWADHLAFLNRSILAQVARIRKGSKHSTIKGTSIEVVLRRTLTEYFPDRFSIGTGQIAASDGDLSPQMDAIIYDRSTFPLLARNEDGSVIVCCESVYGCIEIKTKWDHEDVEDHFNRFTAVDRKGHEYFRSNSSEDDASYSVICIEPLGKLNLASSTLKEVDRLVMIASLERAKAWVSDWGEDSFSEVPSANALEVIFCELLRDCMRKQFVESGSLEHTYEAVRAYFGWTRR